VVVYVDWYLVVVKFDDGVVIESGVCSVDDDEWVVELVCMFAG